MNNKIISKSLKYDVVFQKILLHLKTKFDTHTIIIYGSRARGCGITDSSDYDIVAIRETGENVREAIEFEGHFIDAWIYSESILEEANASLLGLKDGLVIEQKKHCGTKLLKKVKEIFRVGPSPIPQWEVTLNVSWLKKMFKRSQLNDIEGNYRKHWLLVDCLEAYFKLRTLWYFGPKESLQWLKKHDRKVYVAFEKALGANANPDDIQNLIEIITSR